MQQLVYKVGDLIVQVHSGRLGLITKSPFQVQFRPTACAEVLWIDDGSTEVVSYIHIVHNGLYRKRT